MRYIVVLSMITLVFIGCKSYDEHSHNENSKTFNVSKLGVPEILNELPVMLEVRNEPDTVLAIRDPMDTSIYIWRLRTYVSSMADDIKITGFGNYTKDSTGEWYLHNYTEKVFGEKEFSEWYFLVKSDQFTWKNAKNGIVKEGKEYVDPINWTQRSDTLQLLEGIWFFIGVDEQGNEVCGYDSYTNLPELLKSR